LIKSTLTDVSSDDLAKIVAYEWKVLETEDSAYTVIQRRNGKVIVILSEKDDGEA
jgi:hypothetical protein